MSALRRCGPLGAAFSLALGLAVTALAGPGDVDSTFGANGRVLLTPYPETGALAIAVQPDRKLVLAGSADDVVPPPPPPPAPLGPFASNRDFLAVRLTPDGGLDPSFGSGGSVRTPIDPGGQPTPDGARAVAIAPDGSVVLGGYTATASGTDFAFARYTPSGALDPTFSGDGIQTVDVGSFDGANAVAVQPDGKIVAVGSAGSAFTVLRLQANGQLDPSFGNGGIVETPLGDPSVRDEARAVLLRRNKIAVVGTADEADFSRSDFAVVRYLPNGSLDPTFGNRGVVSTVAPGEQRPYAVVGAPDGKLVVAGGSDGGIRIVRYLASGSLDRAFGTSGIVTTPFKGIGTDALAIGLQADGKLVVSGTGGNYDLSAFVAARYWPDGSLDSSFGVGGKAVYAQPTYQLYGGGAVLQPSVGRPSAGRLVMVGQTWEQNADHALAIGGDLGPLEPTPVPERCQVPRLVHLPLATARVKVRRANCRIGRVRFVKAKRFRGRVVSQSLRAGRSLPPGTRVNLVVGRR